MIVDALSQDIRALTDEDESVLKGEVPFKTIVQSIAQQLEEAKSFSKEPDDRTNYFDVMYDEFELSQRINKAAIEEFELDEGKLNNLKELFNDAVMSMMNEFGIDLYQIDEPMKLAYIIYTNFVLVNNQQQYFNYCVKKQLAMEPLESDAKIAYARMMQGEPDEMFGFAKRWADPVPEDMIVPFLRDSGQDDILPWVEDGFLPESILLSTVFNNTHSFEYNFVSYMQDERMSVPSGS